MIEPGTVAAQRFTWTATVDGEAVITVAVNWLMGEEHLDPPWTFGDGQRFEVSVAGNPSLDVTFRGLQPAKPEDGLVRNPGIVATAMHCVNAVPYVCEAAPGIASVPRPPPDRRARRPMTDDDRDRERDDGRDYLGIVRLQAAYGDTVTRRAWDEMATLFDDGASVIVDTGRGEPIEATGGAEIGDFIARSIERFEFFEFVPLNTVVDIDATTGDGRGRLYIQELRPGCRRRGASPRRTASTGIATAATTDGGGSRHAATARSPAPPPTTGGTSRCSQCRACRPPERDWTYRHTRRAMIAPMIEPNRPDTWKAPSSESVLKMR